MDGKLLEKLRAVTPEEERLLKSGAGIDRSIYMRSDSQQIDSRLLLEKGKLITVRPHTRFARFPGHTHNYVEMVYMCSGETTHIISGTRVVLRTGELLILSQRAVQEIEPAGEGDVAVNFIILPQFFDTAISMLDEGENPIRSFLVGCLRGEVNGSPYLHFQVADILPIQNLIENLIWTLTNRQMNKRSINQITMGLLFLQLVNHTETLRTDPSFSQQQLTLQILRYVEEHYADGSLSDVASLLHYDPSTLSRLIKRETGKNFTDLIQQKRLSQAEFLLRTTSMRVIDIAQSVGYDNLSYFHRLFQHRFSTTPYKYRKCK